MTRLKSFLSTWRGRLTINRNNCLSRLESQLCLLNINNWTTLILSTWLLATNGPWTGSKEKGLIPSKITGKGIWARIILKGLMKRIKGAYTSSSSFTWGLKVKTRANRSILSYRGQKVIFQTIFTPGPGKELRLCYLRLIPGIKWVSGDQEKGMDLGSVRVGKKAIMLLTMWTRNSLKSVWRISRKRFRTRMLWKDNF